MQTSTISPPGSQVRRGRPDPPVRNFSVSFGLVFASAALGAILLTNVPLFVCMPVINDVTFYDIQAWNVLQGGVLYRDFLEPNLPGVVWIHAAVRSVLGSSTEVLRLFDLTVFASIVVAAGLWSFRAGRSATASLLIGCICFLFYFSISEWNHCQRDMWMLAFVMAGMFFRIAQIARIRDAGKSNAVVFSWALCEGVCWAAGLWVKPMIVFPAATCWVTGVLLARPWTRNVVDLGGLLLGGLLVGGAGVAWLWSTDAWPYFVETLVDWNPLYFAAGKDHWTTMRFLAMGYRLFPWLLLHLLAVPVAVFALVRGWRHGRSQGDAAELGAEFRQAFLAACYLAWTTQAFLMQHLFDYVHAPGIVLAIVLLANSSLAVRRPWYWKAGLATFLLLAILGSPVLRRERLSCWSECLAYGSSPVIKDRLRMLLDPNWQDLERIEQFLVEQNVGDREVLCYNDNVIHLYQSLGVQPPTRFVYVDQVYAFFPQRAHLFEEAMEQARPRLIVADLISVGLSDEQAIAVGPSGAHALPPSFPQRLRDKHPWSLPVVFRAGQYVVFSEDSNSETSGTDRVPSTAGDRRR